MPIKDFIHHYPRALFNDIPRVGAHFYDIPNSHTVKHATHKTNRSTHKIQGNNITLTTTQVQEAIKQSKNNNSQGPDKLSIRHLKHIGPLGLVFLTSMLKTALNTNIMPHIWKLANIVPIQKPNKDIDNGTSFRPISLLSVIADIGEEPYSLHNSKYTRSTHATREQNTTLNSDGTTHIKQHPSKGVQSNSSPCANNHCSTQYEQSFRHNKHTHTNQKAATDHDSRHNH